MVVEITHRHLLMIACSALTYVGVYNMCKYFHVDEKDVVKRLISVKNHEFRGHTPVNNAANNAFAITRSNFKFAIFSKLFNSLKLTDYLKSLLDRADISLQVDTFVILTIFIGAFPLILGLVFSPVIAILCPVLLFIPIFYLNFRIKKRTTMFTQQLPEAIDLLCNALRAGHSLFSAFDVIVKEMPDPINKIFKVLTDEVALGIDVKDAMKKLQDMMPESVDLRFFTTVVILQREIGGNLIKLLEILSTTIRERFKMIGQLKAQTMQAKLSGIIVSVIPPIIAVILFFMAPEYMDYLIHHLWGKIALSASVVLMIVGFIIINKITDIDI